MESHVESDHPRAARALDGLGRVALRRADVAPARQFFERSLAVRQRSLGVEHPAVTMSVEGLSWATWRGGDAPGALELLDRAAVVERTRGPVSLDLAQVQHVMAMIHSGAGQTAEAQRLLRTSIEMAERAAGPGHQYVSREYYNLACLSVLAGERTAALALLQDALDHGFAGTVIFDGRDLAALRGSGLRGRRCGSASSRRAPRGARGRAVTPRESLPVEGEISGPRSKSTRGPFSDVRPAGHPDHPDLP